MHRILDLHCPNYPPVQNVEHNVDINIKQLKFGISCMCLHKPFFWALGNICSKMQPSRKLRGPNYDKSSLTGAMCITINVKLITIHGWTYETQARSISSRWTRRNSPLDLAVPPRFSERSRRDEQSAAAHWSSTIGRSIIAGSYGSTPATSIWSWQKDRWVSP
jgi:hypothetical protein